MKSGVLFIFILLVFSCENVNQTYTKEKFISEGLKNIKRYKKSELNLVLQSRGGDTLFSIFPTESSLSTNYITSPNIRVYNRSGHLLLTMCADHFPNPLSHISKLNVVTSQSNTQDIDSIKFNYLNGQEVFERISEDTEFLVFLPWSINDTNTNIKYRLNPYRDWFSVLIIDCNKSDLKTQIFYEAVHKLTEHRWSDEAFLNAEYEQMKALYPKNFKD